MTPEIKHLRAYGEQKLTEAGIYPEYRKYAGSILRHAESETQIDQAVNELLRNCKKWFK